MPIDRSTWELVHNAEIGREMVEALPAALYGQPTLEAFVRALGHGLQVLEDRIAERFVALSLATAADGDLDLLGNLVGERRDGLVDADYRRFIAARLAANRSEGTTDDMVKVLRLLTNSEVIGCFNLPGFPEFHLYFLSEAPLSAEVVERMARLMVAVKPAGVAMILAEVIEDTRTDPSNPIFSAGTLATGLLARQLYP